MFASEETTLGGVTVCFSVFFGTRIIILLLKILFYLARVWSLLGERLHEL